MKTLLMGNTGYVTKEFVNLAFPNDSVLIYGKTDLKSSKKSGITVLSAYVQEHLMEEVFESYEFDQIVYFSNSLTYRSEEVGELEQLQSVLNYTKEQEDLKLLYLTGPETDSYEQIILRTSQGICLNWDKHPTSSVKVLQSPYFYSATNKDDYLYKLLNTLDQNETIEFIEAEKEATNFVNTEDIAELLYKIFDSWEKETEILTIDNPFQITFADLADGLKKLAAKNEQVKVVFHTERHAGVSYVNHQDKILRQRYGWFIRHSVIDDLPELFAVFKKQHKIRHYKNNLNKQVTKTQSNNFLRKLTEVIILFVMSELVHTFANGQLQFRLIDVRLLFVVLISTVYGASFGIFAAVLSAGALAFADISSGTDWQLLLYNTEHWLPFVAYIFMAGICGFIQTKNQDDNQSLQKENDVLKEQNNFLQEAYSNIIQDKQQLKRQIIGSRDGFSKFFTIFKQLDQPSEDEILRRTITILQEKLETDDVRIYEFQGKTLKNKVLFSQYPNEESVIADMQLELLKFPKVGKIIEERQMWTNKSLLPDYPAYVVGIDVNRQLKYLIWIQEIPYSRVTLYHTNFLRMISEIAESLLSKAYYYQEYADHENKKTKTIANEQRDVIDFEQRRIK